ncbi:ankyrin repeat domain-containing protein [Legionella anisa]|uniref:Ankyrin repeat domain-containing protein n=1 Tax=Legionella anisa TaxID=28082 RepID=A0AAX0WRE0_9GAMM|nr:ankyrin repeat domain-containing protein [Legionella anisa]AWN75620.1 hypothetical protein DLD14_18230 [Legionella anisa]KTC76413.1 glycosyltransferase [Legionella anisa]MCW8424184.1 ankyrin repeat domain-containing protein [Legionella anisa]MCW8446698.1 ankyrin repeat domain-containing protein [Legionella anisa]PNL60468.1 hypothetical protein A6J39_004190 [Legionella anisa]
MKAKVDTTPSKHGQLILLMQALGYTASEEGVCNGYAYMGMQAVLLNELDVFKRRINFLLDIPLDDFEKAAIQLASPPAGEKETKEALKKILEDYLKANNLLVDTLAFFDGIELTQQRHLYPHLFGSNEALEQGSFIKLTLPQKIEDEGGIIALPPVLSGIYRQKEMVSEYLTLLRKKINALIPKPTEPMGLAITGHGQRHAITISFDPQQDKWVLIDANTPPAQEYSEDDAMAQALLVEGACSTNGTAAINTHVFLMSGNEPLQHALTEWMQEVQKLSEQDMRTKTKWEDSRGGTLLNAVIRGNNSELIPRLISQGADVNKPTADKFTPLLIAIINNDKESVQELLKCGAAVDTVYNFVSTPLRVAIAKKNFDIVEMLLKNGADPNFRPQVFSQVVTQTAFEDAIELNDYNLVELMLAHGAKFAKPLSGKNLIMDPAVKNDWIDSIRAMLDHGLNPNGMFSEDNNPLLLAVQNNRLEVARLLLAYGANPEQEDEFQEQSAHEFAEKNNLKEFLDLFDNPPPRKEITHEPTTEKEAASPDNDHAINDFINDLKKYCETRRAEWGLPKWMHVNEKSAQYKTNLITLKFGFSVEDKIKAAEKLIAALENKKARERLTDFDIAALLNSRLYSTVVKKHEGLFDQIEEVKTYKNKAQQLGNTPENPAA